MKAQSINEQQLQVMKSRPGFIAALDQSGGSTPGALKLYGNKESAWSNESEMFAIVHQMRTRIITSPTAPSDKTSVNGRSPRLQELTPQKTHLLAKPSLVRKRHREASLPVMRV